MKITEYLFLLFIANISFISGFVVAMNQKKMPLLIPACLGAGLIFAAAYCQSNELHDPLYKFVPALVGIYYTLMAVKIGIRVKQRPDRKNMAFLTGFVAILHFGATAASFFLEWPLGG